MKKTLIAAAVIAAVISTSCSSTKKLSAVQSKSETSLTDVVETIHGKVRGVLTEDGKVAIYAGIPYAKPPVGELRWKEPQEADDWEGILTKDTFAPIAMQKKQSGIVRFIFRNFIYHDSDGDREDYAPLSEDCLYLNIWTPSDAEPGKKYPVLVYIHGGSLMTGSSIYETHDGKFFAENGVIVVSIAYRLGVFGYFASEELAAESPNGTTGNYGLLDQIKALDWINKNIESFGGDRNNITIAGESAGSSSVNALCASPLSKGLFKRAIGESSGVAVESPVHTFRSMEDALSMGKEIMAEFKCSSMEEMRKLSAEKLVKTKHDNNSMTVDGYALPESVYEIYRSGKNHEEALLNGFNSEEAYFFNFFTGFAKKKDYEKKVRDYFGKYADRVLELYPAATNDEAKYNWNQISGAVMFAYSHHAWTTFVSAQGKPAYQYFFTMQNKIAGANHTGEIIYAYGNLPETKYYTAADHGLSKMMSQYWLNFIKTGNPNGENLPLWHTESQSPGTVIEFGESVHERENPYKDLYPIIEALMHDKAMEAQGRQE